MFFRIFILVLFLIELLSVFAWGLPVFNMVCFGVIAALCFLLSLKNLRYGIYIALAELVIGSHGYLFSLNIGGGDTLLSIRMGIFGAVMFAWLIKVFCDGGFGQYLDKLKEFEFTKYYIYLSVILVWGLVWGMIRGNNFGNIFLDFNNWLFFLYLLPLIDVRLDKVFWKDLKVVLFASLSWLIIKTLVLLYIFSHQFIWALPEVYKWVRDTRVGEITMMSNNFYRIFIQSQIYCLVGFFVLLPILNFKFRILNQFRISKFFNFKYYLLLVGCLTTVIISFSRSFWVGLVIGLGIYFIYLIYSNWKKGWVKVAGNNILKVLVAVSVSVGLIFLIINLPPKLSGESLGSLIGKRTTVIEAAGYSRINMVKPLVKGIADHPVIGSGFGTTITYSSVDPRVLYTTAGASGEYTTYAFEWSYLDLLLKVGLAGVFIYALLIFKILQSIWQQIKNFQFSIFNFQTISNDPIFNKKRDHGLLLGVGLALVALLAVNVFTPYLNHPLGIGVILLISVYRNE